jgi:hypothetical protein
MKRLLILLIMLPGCAATKYISTPCQPPPVLQPVVYATSTMPDKTPANEIIKGLVTDLQQCKAAVAERDKVLQGYR